MSQPASSNIRKNVGAVVLAGGRSRRMGFDKANLPFAGSTFLEAVVNRIGKVVGRTIVVGNNRQRLEQFGFENNDSVEVVFDEKTDSGPMEGIRVGLQILEADFPLAFVSSCDVPLIEPGLITFLCSHIGSHEAIIPKDPVSNRVFGMTAIYQTGLHPRINDLIKADRLRVSELSNEFFCRFVSTEELKTIDPQLNSLLNINHMDDYLALLQQETLPIPKDFQ